MNNKCNKKLLSSILVALSLSSGISINDKIANANYKDEDRSKLNELVSSIKGSKENASEVAQNLFNAINGIYQKMIDEAYKAVINNDEGLRKSNKLISDSTYGGFMMPYLNDTSDKDLQLSNDR